VKKEAFGEIKVERKKGFIKRFNIAIDLVTIFEINITQYLYW